MSVDLDAAGRATCRRLAQRFGVPTSVPEASCEPEAVSIGIEVEVPWSSYFPDLWTHFRMDKRRIADMPADELQELNRLCAAREKHLLPRLQATVGCGIPRGNDRYWEFAFPPVHTAEILVEQVSILTDAGLLPRNRKHSLHVTLGGLKPCRALYYLSMLLELEFVDPQRIRDGIAQQQQAIYTGWARKGRAGIFLKGADDLQAGAAHAAELRILQLPRSTEEFSRLMGIVQWGANAIADVIAGRPTEAAASWAEIERACTAALLSQGLPDTNWGKGDEYGGEQAAIWLEFADRMPTLREELGWLGIFEAGAAPIPERAAFAAEGA